MEQFFMRFKGAILFPIKYWGLSCFLILVDYALAGSAVVVELFGKPPGGITNSLWEYIQF
jgi:hypothetical protein